MKKSKCYYCRKPIKGDLILCEKCDKNREKLSKEGSGTLIIYNKI